MTDDTTNCVDMYALGDADRAPEPTPYVPRFTATMTLFYGLTLTVRDDRDQGVAVVVRNGTEEIAEITLTDTEADTFRSALRAAHCVDR